FERLGLTIASLKGNPLDALSKTAAAMREYGDKAELAKIQTQLMSRSGMDLNPVLDRLAPGFDEVRDSAKKAGQVLDPDVSQAAAKADTDLGNLATRLKVDVTPSIVGTTNALLDMFANFDKGIRNARGKDTGKIDLPSPTVPKPPSIPTP